MATSGEKTSPFLEIKFGWDKGSDDWNYPLDEDLVKFSYMFDRNIDGIVSTLPAVVNGQAYFNTQDNRLYFAVNGTYYSAPTPKWFEVVNRADGIVYRFTGTTLEVVESAAAVDARLDAVELTLTNLAGDSGSSLVGYKSSLPGAIKSSLSDLLNSTLSLTSYSPVGDGNYHPLSERYTSLAQAQAAYPNAPVTSLTDSIDWAALYAASYAAAISGMALKIPAIHLVINRTCMTKASWVGEGPESWWAQDGRGTIIETYGAGNALVWTDRDVAGDSPITPAIVLGRSGVSLYNLTVKCPTTARWSTGIFIPCLKRVKLINVDIKGQWTTAGLYPDATWSTLNTTLKSLHPEIETDTGLNELTVVGGSLEGKWAVSCLGTTRDPSTFVGTWIWGFGGTSDHVYEGITFRTNGLDSELLTDGGAYWHDAAINNSAGAGQGINFSNCAFRVASRYMCKFGRANRLTFSNNYGETLSSWLSTNGRSIFDVDATLTGSISVVNDYIIANSSVNGVVTGYFFHEQPWQSNFKVSGLRNQGRFFTPNLFMPGLDSGNIPYIACADAVNISQYAAGVYTPYLRMAPTALRAYTASSMTLGTGTIPFSVTYSSQYGFGAASNRVLSGSVAPEGNVTAAFGSLYLYVNTAGSSGSLYIKQTGTGNTGWVLK